MTDSRRPRRKGRGGGGPPQPLAPAAELIQLAGAALDAAVEDLIPRVAAGPPGKARQVHDFLRRALIESADLLAGGGKLTGAHFRALSDLTGLLETYIRQTEKSVAQLEAVIRKARARLDGLRELADEL